MNRRNLNLFISIALLAGLLLGNILTALAQPILALSIDSINDQNFPAIETFLSVLDGQGYPVAGLAKDNFSLAEDGLPVSAFDLATLNQSPINLVILIDVRASMGFGGDPTYLERVIQAANLFIDTLAPQDSVGLVKMASPAAIVQELTTDKAAVKTAISSLTSEDYYYGDIYDAIVMATGMLQNVNGRRAAILLTNGSDSAIPGHYTFEMALGEAVQKKVVFFPITWSGAKEDLMEQLAQLTHGKAQFLGFDSNVTQQALDGALVPVGEALTELRAQYKINFSSAVLADNKEHSLVVKVDYQGTHVEQSISFTARSSTVTVSLPDLQAGATVGGIVTIAPVVAPPSVLAKMDISLDGQPLTSKSVAPFEYQWDTTAASDGEHTIVVNATDTSGNTGETTITLVVARPVTISITNPVADAIVEGKINIAAEVNALAGIDRVEFRIDDNVDPTVTITSAPYEFEWDPAGMQPGTHRIHAKAVDINGYSAESTISFSIPIPPGGGPWWIIVVVVVVAGLMIPLVLRSRRSKQAVESLPTEVPGPGPVPGTGGFASASLRELDGLAPNQVWPLAGSEIRLGRKRDENDIPVKGLSASRQHAVIYLQGNQHIIASLKPDNPALVNGQPVLQPRLLRNGDEIRIGETILRYESY